MRKQKTWQVEARASILAAVAASTIARVISSACHRLLILVTTPPDVDGMACVMVGTEASLNRGIHDSFSLAWGLVDGHVLDTLPRRGVLARILPTLPRHQVISLLLRRTLDERAHLLVSVAPLGIRLLREPSQQSRHGGNVLACPSETWGTLIVFEDPPVYIMGGGARVPTVPTASNLSLEFDVLLFYLEARLLKLLLPLS
jgi:hypothetical protein